MSSRILRLSIAAGTALLVVSGGTATAQATSGQQSTATKTCLVHVESNKTQCYGSFREAIAVSTNGAISDAPLSARTAAKDKGFGKRLAATSGKAVDRHQAVLYEDRDFYGDTAVFLGPACQNGNGRDYIGELEGRWNDVVSSVWPVTCWVELFEHAHQSGSSREYQQQTEYIGDDQNDRASSLALL